MSSVQTYVVPLIVNYGPPDYKLARSRPIKVTNEKTGSSATH